MTLNAEEVQVSQKCQVDLVNMLKVLESSHNRRSHVLGVGEGGGGGGRAEVDLIC